jgi:hypothetical protein
MRKVVKEYNLYHLSHDGLWSKEGIVVRHWTRYQGGLNVVAAKAALTRLRVNGSRLIQTRPIVVALLRKAPDMRVQPLPPFA